MVATGEEQRGPRIEVDGFGFLPGDSHEIVRRYTITNKNNASARLISLGAGIQSITIPNKTDHMADVVLGFDNVADYLKHRYIGRIVGPVCQPFSLTSNAPNNDDAGNSLDLVNWDSYVLDDRVVMTYVSRAGELMVQVTYDWDDEDRLHVDVRATSTRSVPVNIASCCLWNLAGHGMGPKDLQSHIVTVNADRLAELDLVKGIPTGAIKNVSKTAYDLRYPTLLNSKQLYKVPGGGYNHSFCITSPSDSWPYRFHARMLHPSSGRYLEVYSNHPTMQIYTGNDFPDPMKIYPPDLNVDNNATNNIKHLEVKLIGKEGIPYIRHSCFALIPQGFPNELNHDKLLANTLHPGKIYVHNIVYGFGVVK